MPIFEQIRLGFQDLSDLASLLGLLTECFEVAAASHGGFLRLLDRRHTPARMFYPLFTSRMLSFCSVLYLPPSRVGARVSSSQ